MLYQRERTRKQGQKKIRGTTFKRQNEYVQDM